MLRDKNKMELEEIVTASQELVNQIIMQAQNMLQTKKVKTCNETISQEKPLESCFYEICCCVTCNAFLKDNADAQCHVTLHLFKEFQPLNNFDTLEVTFGANGKVYLKCSLCDFYCLSKMSDAHEFLREHFKTETHRKRSKFFKVITDDLGLEELDEQINKLDFKRFTYNTAESIFSSLLCNICDIPVKHSKQDEHVLGKSHQKKIQEKQNDTVIEKKTAFDIKNNYYYKCFVCNTSFCNASILLDHYKTPEHKWKIEALKVVKKCSYTNFKRSGDMQVLSCSLCNINFNDFKSTFEHLLGKQHNVQLKLTSGNMENNESNTETVSSVQVINKSLNSSEYFRKLTKKQRKKAKAAENVSSVVTTNNMKKNEVVNKFEASVEELNQLGFSLENIQPLHAHGMSEKISDDVVSLDINKSQTIKLTRKQRKKAKAVENVSSVVTTNNMKMNEVVNKFEASVEELNQLGFSLENIQPLHAHGMSEKISDDFVSLDINKSQTIKLTRKQRKKAKAAENVSSVVTTNNLKMNEVVNKFEASVEELNQLGFSLENIEPVYGHGMSEKISDDFVLLDINKSQTKKHPVFLAKAKSSRTPKIEDQRNTFAENVLLNGKIFIKHFIDPGLENIFNFDNDKLNLLKLGITLTFPLSSDRICIPCKQQFPNDVQSLFEHLQNEEHLKSICNIQAYDREFENAPQQFSDLKLAKMYMHVSDQSIKCYACDIEIDDNDNMIRQHIKGLIHKEKSKLWKKESEQLINQYITIYKDIWYYAEVFFCEICQTRCEFEIDFAMHLIDPEHKKKVYQHKAAALKFDLCLLCHTYWFGKADSYEVHCKSHFHKDFAKNNNLMVPNLAFATSEYLDSIDKNVNFLVNESNKVDLEIEKEIVLLKAIVETVKPTYPNAEAYIFGSRLSNLGFPGSDVDILLDCENVYHKSSTEKQSQQYIKSVKTCFETTSNSWILDEVLYNARVPIMKLRHIPTNLNCNISFVDGLSVEKSRLVGIYNRAFPICRKLILFMKKWLTLCRIFGPDYITTFAISWCVIFYLQSQGILPSVHELIQRKMESKTVDGWECGFEEIITEEKSNFSYKEYLKGFFTYFANFDYKKCVACPYLGKTIDKHAFAYTDQLPSEMDIYKKRLKDNEMEIFRFDSPMCIQDPLDLSQNLTKDIKKQQLRYFRQYCILSCEKC